MVNEWRTDTTATIQVFKTDIESTIQVCTAVWEKEQYRKEKKSILYCCFGKRAVQKRGKRQFCTAVSEKEQYKNGEKSILYCCFGKRAVQKRGKRQFCTAAYEKEQYKDRKKAILYCRWKSGRNKPAEWNFYSPTQEFDKEKMMIPIHDILVRSMSGYLFMIPILVLYFIGLKKTGKTQSFLHTTAVFVFGYYLFGLLTVTGIGFTRTITFRPNISWIPFAGMGSIDTILNIILFVPLGFFLPLLYEKYRNIGAVVLTGFLFSLTVEIFQMFGWGSSDINDLMTNTVGACIGFLTYCLLSKILPVNLKKQFQSNGVSAMVEVIFFAICTFAIMVTAQIWFVHSVLNNP